MTLDLRCYSLACPASIQQGIALKHSYICAQQMIMHAIPMGIYQKLLRKEHHAKKDNIIGPNCVRCSCSPLPNVCLPLLYNVCVTNAPTPVL